ncbi:hypothetical protein Taro_030166 [Colocasia esculenta]|uniref:Uncharacterized protein n=1 Tax=Colocasia esculenta TaxID=4460 RepID=A0A843VNB5_COLES|nr:hypothetical protein [Colocasia esculenta]
MVPMLPLLLHAPPLILGAWKLRSPPMYKASFGNLRVVHECEARALKQHSEKINMGANEFVKMLILDGCFIIEYLMERVLEETREMVQLLRARGMWVFSHLRNNLLVLENQIPFFILLICQEISIHTNQVQHLLHLHHLSLDLKLCPHIAAQPSNHICQGQSLAQINFSQPYVQETTSSKLRNLITLEQCCPKVGSYFTSCVVFMDNFINIERDVVIESTLGCDIEVDNIFITLCKGMDLDYENHWATPLFISLNAHYKDSRNRW